MLVAVRIAPQFWRRSDARYRCPLGMLGATGQRSGPIMSQFDNPRLDEVKRVLRRLQDLGAQHADPPPGAGSLPKSHQRPGTLSAALSAARHQPEDPMPPPRPPFAIERAMPNAVGEQRVRPWHNFGIMLAVACVSAGVLTVFLTFASISRQAANPSRLRGHRMSRWPYRPNSRSFAGRLRSGGPQGGPIRRPCKYASPRCSGRMACRCRGSNQSAVEPSSPPRRRQPIMCS